MLWRSDRRMGLRGDIDQQEPAMLDRRNLILAATIAPAIGAALSEAVKAGEAAQPPDIAKLPRRKVELVPPPFVHPHEQATKEGPAVIEVALTIEEKEIVIDQDGTKVHAMTYNGSVPGPLIVVHQDDYVELTLINPDTNTLEHNIDFHASTGALGGGELTKVMPGEQVKLRWRATRPGVFVYHCAPGGVMIPWHVVSGMNGAIMVLPRDGLKDDAGKPLTYDKAFYIGEQDFYVPRDETGKFKSYPSPLEAFADVEVVMKGLIPTHVVFNGAVGALTGEKALAAKVGERVLIVHSQANRDTRPHLIGGHGDFVWELGKFNTPPARDLETWFVRGGSAAAAFYTFRQPGIYAYVNHNLIEAVMLGATAHFKVEGNWDDDLMMQIEPPKPFQKSSG
jgi:nitrite reductase (NO-forming)